MTVYGYSEYQLRQYEDPESFTLKLTANDDILAHGKHIARTRGCFGCHGQELQGRVFTEQWDWVKRAVAPNLAAFAKNHDPAQLERAIRHGIGANDRALWSMPSYNYVRMNDHDLSALILYLQSAPVVDNPLPAPAMGMAARWSLITADDGHMADWVHQVPELKLTKGHDPVRKAGEYVAMTTCNECHGLDLQGDMGTPSLAAMIKAYDFDNFRRLMKQGIALGDREDLGLMTMVAKDRFAYFTDTELEQLYAYLIDLEVVHK